MSQQSDLNSPRKSPVQARSIATVEAILDASIQVLLREGIDRCTTTRVAERAGVSVGTLYQYFPHREAMMNAVLARYLQELAETLEQACAACHDVSLDEMAQGLANGWIKAKLGNPELTRALYAVAENYATPQATCLPNQRIQNAVVGMLETAKEGTFEDFSLVAIMTIGALYGPVRLMLEGRSALEDKEAFRRHLAALVQAYLQQMVVNRA